MSGLDSIVDVIEKEIQFDSVEEEEFKLTKLLKVGVWPSRFVNAVKMFEDVLKPAIVKINDIPYLRIKKDLDNSLMISNFLKDCWFIIPKFDQFPKRYDNQTIIFRIEGDIPRQPTLKTLEKTVSWKFGGRKVTVGIWDKKHGGDEIDRNGRITSYNLGSYENSRIMIIGKVKKPMLILYNTLIIFWSQYIYSCRWRDIVWEPNNGLKPTDLDIGRPSNGYEHQKWLFVDVECPLHLLRYYPPYILNLFMKLAQHVGCAKDCQVLNFQRLQMVSNNNNDYVEKQVINKKRKYDLTDSNMLWMDKATEILVKMDMLVRSDKGITDKKFIDYFILKMMSRLDEIKECEEAKLLSHQ